MYSLKKFPLTHKPQVFAVFSEFDIDFNPEVQNPQPRTGLNSIRYSRGAFDSNGLNEDLVDQTWLYMPKNITVNDSVSYGKETLGIIGQALAQAVAEGNTSDGIDMIQTGEQIVSQLAESAVDTATTLVGANQSPVYIAKALQRAQRITPGFVNNGIRAGIRHTANPHIRALFNEVGLREFSFDFEMIPESREEAVMIHRIIKYFRAKVYPKFAATPERDPRDGVDQEPPANDAERAARTARRLEGFGRRDQIAYRFPSMFQIEFAWNEGGRNQLVDSGPVNSALFRTKPGYLTGITTNFDTQGSMSMIDMGAEKAFTAYQLSIKFMEDRTLSQEDVYDGY